MSRNRKVYQFTKEGEFVAAHKSTTKAAATLGLDESTIRKARDKSRFAGGFAWRSSKVFDSAQPVNYKKLPKILVFDIETTPLEAYIWQHQVWNANISQDKILSEWFMLTWSAKWLFDDKMLSARVTSEEALAEDDERITRELWDLFDEADIVIAHNGGKFDVPNMNTRFLVNKLAPPSTYQIIDTLKVARREFGFTHNNLDALARVFGLDGKLSTDFELWRSCKHGDEKALKEMETYNKQDVLLLEEVYLVLRPWIKNHPSAALFIESGEMVCPSCGHNHLIQKGHYMTQVSKFETYQCQRCGALSRSRTNTISVDVRKNLLVSLAR